MRPPLTDYARIALICVLREFVWGACRSPLLFPPVVRMPRRKRNVLLSEHMEDASVGQARVMVSGQHIPLSP